ncbi:hypothetical protein Cme02nite_48210 [Catellatospora methionotrophica]|uniref:Glycosyl hydrolases family 43 n=1 Tax=Catellatospora methionotrophica TaxID=121620 RepID=A0A8J3PH90_9ACTN|nr:family 43 glycosylhydrolase [Catellatospora methionotrophica]GIG16489.1 hypothetical protein Cme02nite_48210 [Catellatospora methionotrophica]
MPRSHRTWLARAGALSLLIAAQLLAGPAPQAGAAHTTTITNFDAAGNQVIRFDTAGNAVDAHDGDLALFGGAYYLYGTSYDCGYRWNGAGSPFCGFKVYSSPDLVHWTDRGQLFDATTATWQTRCNGNTYGCYRPHVVYNATTGRYVLWINSYDNVSGFHVFTSTQPTGPFTQVADPAVAVNSGPPASGLKNGDHDTFVDDDGTAYLAYTDWVSGGGIVVERLNASYLSGTGSFVRVTPSATEAPALFKRNGNYYLTYSDPNCGYCSGTGTSYRTATSPLGTWSGGTNISPNSCGGQPSFVTPISLTSGTAYLYGSDLWNNAAPNEALANFYWAPLTFSGTAISPMTCQNTVTLPLTTGAAGAQDPIADLDQHDGVTGFRRWADIGPVSRIQTFVPSRSGTLTSASLTTFQTGSPNAGLTFDIYLASASFQPTGSPLYTVTVPAASIGWSPRAVTVNPDISVTAGTRYGIVARSTTTSGLYGWAFNENAPYPSGGSAYKNSGGSWTAETNRSLKFQTTVSGSASGWTYCAVAENGTCAVSGTAVVRYGAGSSYLYKTVTGSIGCNQTAFGGDPIFGTVKHCDSSPQPPGNGWTSCAVGETGTCTFTGTRAVAYGASGAFLYKTATGGIGCNQTAFGGDPIFGTVKSCYYK